MLFKQSGKASLFEMFVTCQRGGHVSLPQDHKRNAIGQRPALICVLVVQFKSAVKPFPCGWDDFTSGYARK